MLSTGAKALPEAAIDLDMVGANTALPLAVAPFFWPGLNLEKEIFKPVGTFESGKSENVTNFFVISLNL